MFMMKYTSMKRRLKALKSLALIVVTLSGWGSYRFLYNNK